MEALFSSQRGNFHQAIIHIGAFRQPVSPELNARIQDDVSTITKKKFTAANVESISSVVGCPVPVEVHGRDIFVDELQLHTIPTGVFRKALLAGVSRQAAGGKRRYDFFNMNFSLLFGYGLGLGSIYLLRKYKPKRFPLLHVPLALTVFFAGIPLAKILWRSAGIATFYVDHHYVKAITNLQCETCLEEVVEYTKKDIATRQVQKYNPNFYDSQTTELFKAKEIRRSGKFDGKKCVVHEKAATEV